MSQKVNNKDNIVIDVRLEAITKLERDFEMNDIPIIGGFAALKIRFLKTHFYRIDIPQIQSLYQNGESWAFEELSKKEFRR